MTTTWKMDCTSLLFKADEILFIRNQWSSLRTLWINPILFLVTILKQQHCLPSKTMYSMQMQAATMKWQKSKYKMKSIYSLNFSDVTLNGLYPNTGRIIWQYVIHCRTRTRAKTDCWTLKRNHQWMRNRISVHIKNIRYIILLLNTIEIEWIGYLL